MTKKKIYLVGGGGHCKSCIDVIESEGKYQIVGIIDISEKIGTDVLGYPVVESDDNIEKLIGQDIYFLITLGQIKSAEKRIRLFETIRNARGKLATVVSPRAHVSQHSEIGEGTVIMHDVIINSGVTIGGNCILNTKCLIEHDSVIGSHSHISTGAIVNGDCVIGDGCFIGSNSSVANSVKIGSNSIIGAGSVVLRDLEGNGTYMGYPVVKVK